MIRTETFKMEHWDRIEPFGGREGLYNIEQALEVAASNSDMLVFTLLDGEKVISIYGTMRLWPGVGEAFTIMCKDIHRYGRALYEFAFATVRIVFNSMSLIRLQCTVAVGFDKGVKFIEGIGFEREGILRKWSPDGKDVYMYAKLKDADGTH